jgi:predicted methyltransferase
MAPVGGLKLQQLGLRQVLPGANAVAYVFRLLESYSGVLHQPPRLPWKVHVLGRQVYRHLLSILALPAIV